MATRPESSPRHEPRPAAICVRLLAALDASDGRRLRRQRNTTPDAIGLEIKRDLLQAVVREDPEPEAIEAWLLRRCSDGSSRASGPVLAMARDVLAEIELARTSESFRRWLEQGAPSADASPRE